MDILFLTQVLPYPLDAGPKTRAYYVLRYLAQSHKVTLLSFTRATDSAEAVEHLRSFCHAVYTVPMVRSTRRDVMLLLRSLVDPRPFLILRDWRPEFAARLGALLQANAYDAIHADQLWMAAYALWARDAHRGPHEIHTILDQHNAVFQIPRRLAHHESNPLKRLVLLLEERKLLRFESEACHRFDRVVWVTEEDRAALAARTPYQGASDGLIPICVDPDATAPVERVAQPWRVTFVGGLHWPPNAEGMVWFARNVWPRVRQLHPDAVLTVIGKDPPAELERLAAQAGSSMDVTGYVADLTPYLRETAAFIVPLRAGGGMRVKILDGWQWGLPIVSTTIGAEGIHVRDGVNLLLADEADLFAERVAALLDDPELAQRIVVAGHATLREEYNWRTRYTDWDEVYRFPSRGRQHSSAGDKHP